MQVNGSSAVRYLLLSLEIFQWQGHSSVIYRPWGPVHNPCVLSIDYYWVWPPSRFEIVGRFNHS